MLGVLEDSPFSCTHVVWHSSTGAGPHSLTMPFIIFSSIPTWILCSLEPKASLLPSLGWLFSYTLDWKWWKWKYLGINTNPQTKLREMQRSRPDSRAAARSGFMLGTPLQPTILPSFFLPLSSFLRISSSCSWNYSQGFTAHLPLSLCSFLCTLPKASGPSASGDALSL